MVPVRFFHAFRADLVRAVAILGDRRRFSAVFPAGHDPGPSPAHHDQVHQGLSEVLDAQGPDQPDLQALEPPDLQRDHLLPLLHELVRIAGGAVLRGAQLPLRQRKHTKTLG